MRLGRTEISIYTLLPQTTRKMCPVATSSRSRYKLVLNNTRTTILNGKSSGLFILEHDLILNQ